MKLAFSTNAFTNYGVTDAIEAIRAAGYDGVELMADRPHLYPPDVTDAAIAGVRAALERAGLAVSNVNAFMLRAIGDIWHPSWIEPDEGERRKRLDHTVQCLNLAAKLGAPSISTEPGGPLPEGMAREEALALFGEGIAAALAAAEQSGVDLLVEPEPGLLIENSGEFLDFVKGFDSPRLGLNFDIGHFYCVGEDPAEAFTKLRRFVRHVHLEDIARTREHKHRIPGDGAIDLERVLAVMNNSGYDGWVTVELYPYEDNPAETARAARARVGEMGL